jgi:peptidoglycan/LPS O-acetylase OafA/YrhL
VPADLPSAVPAGIRRGSTYFPELESLRGLAIVLVFVFHADGALLFPGRNRVGAESPLPMMFVWAGHSGVTLFFVLSAFLLSLPFLDEARGGRPVSRRQFYERRALRILPLYWTAVLVGTILTSQALTDLWHGLPYLAFLESKPNLTTPMRPFSDVWWSLATEVQFYALLPLVALVFGRSRRVTLALLAVYAVVYAVLALGVVVHLEPWFRAQSIIGRGPLFLFGILAAWFYRGHGETVRARLAATRWLAAGGADLLLAAVFLALAFLLRWSNARGFLTIEQTRWHVWHVPEGALWTAVLLILLLAPLRLKVLFSNRMLARLGVLSYSIYLLHLPVLRYSLRPARRLFPNVTGWNATAACWFAIVTLLCVALASITYRFIERPFLVRKARLDGPARAAEVRAA